MRETDLTALHKTFYHISCEISSQSSTVLQCWRWRLSLHFWLMWTYLARDVFSLLAPLSLCHIITAHLYSFIVRFSSKCTGSTIVFHRWTTAVSASRFLGKSTADFSRNILFTRMYLQVPVCMVHNIQPSTLLPCHSWAI